MLRDIYLYMNHIDIKSRIVKSPELFLCHDDFSEGCMAGKGLAGIAEMLSAEIHVNWGRNYEGEVKIRSHPHPLDIAYDKHTNKEMHYALPEKYKQKFQKFLPKEFKVNWIDERQTLEFLEQVEGWQRILKNESRAK